MLKDGVIRCDACGKEITRASAAPAQGWERLHNLCSSCFAARTQTAVR